MWNRIRGFVSRNAPALVAITLIAALLTTVGVPQLNWGNTATHTAKHSIGTVSVVDAAGSVDYTLIGNAATDTSTFNTALSTLPATGGTLQVMSTGTINFNATVTRAIGNVVIMGSGYGTTFTYGGNAPFAVGGNGWIFANCTLSVAPTVGSYAYTYSNVMIGSTLYNTSSPIATGATGRTGYVIAASDAPASVKAQADAPASANLAADVAVAVALGYTDIQISEGAFTTTANIVIPANTYFHGTNKYTSVITASGNAISNAGAISITGSNVEISDLKVIIAAGAGAANTRPNAIAATSRDCLSIHDCVLVGDRTVGDDSSSARQVGVYIDNSLGSTVDNNWIDGFQRHGIYISNITSLSRYCTISNNHVSNSYFHNIAMGAYFSIISNNTSLSSVTASGYLLIGGRANTVIGNTSVLDQFGYLANSSCTDSLFSGNTADTPAQYAFQCSGSGTTRNRFDGNSCNLGGATKWAEDTGASGNIIVNTNGYIASGEICTISGQLAGVTPAGIMLSVDNPFGQAVRVLSVDVEVTTQGASSGTMCVGIGSSATTDYATIFSVLPCNNGTTYPYFFNSLKTATYGVQTNPINWATGAGNRYLNFYAHVANAAYVATYTITCMGN